MSRRDPAASRSPSSCVLILLIIQTGWRKDRLPCAHLLWFLNIHFNKSPSGQEWRPTCHFLRLFLTLKHAVHPLAALMHEDKWVRHLEEARWKPWCHFTPSERQQEEQDNKKKLAYVLWGVSASWSKCPGTSRVAPNRAPACTTSSSLLWRTWPRRREQSAPSPPRWPRRPEVAGTGSQNTRPQKQKLVSVISVRPFWGRSKRTCCERTSWDQDIVNTRVHGDKDFILSTFTFASKSTINISSSRYLLFYLYYK